MLAWPGVAATYCRQRSLCLGHLPPKLSAERGWGRWWGPLLPLLLLASRRHRLLRRGWGLQAGVLLPLWQPSFWLPPTNRGLQQLPPLLQLGCRQPLRV